MFWLQGDVALPDRAPIQPKRSCIPGHISTGSDRSRRSIRGSQLCRNSPDEPGFCQHGSPRGRPGNLKLGARGQSPDFAGNRREYVPSNPLIHPNLDPINRTSELSRITALWDARRTFPVPVLVGCHVARPKGSPWLPSVCIVVSILELT